MNWEGFLKTWEKPSLFLFGFGLITVYIPGFIGASIPTGWIFLIIFAPILLCFYETRITLNHIYGTIFIFYVLLSLIWTQNLNIAFFIFLQILSLVCAFCLGSSSNFKIKPVIVGLIIGLIVSDGVAYFQYYKDFTAIFTVTGNVAGLFVNKNIFCEISVILLITCLVFRMWWGVIFTLPGILMVHSRGAIAALLVGSLSWIYRENKIAGYIYSTLILLGGILYVLHNNSSISVFERFDLWGDTARGLTFFGNGVGSFEILYPYYAVGIDTSVARPRFAHNDLLQLFFEFGIVGLIPVLIIANILKLKSNVKIILYTIGIVSMFSFPLHIPVPAFLAFLFAGYITKFDDTVWDIRNSRGLSLFKCFKAPSNTLSRVS